MSDITRLYADKSQGYFTAARHDLLGMLPRNPHARLLEIGAGLGATLREAKASGLAALCVGVDLVCPEGRDLEGIDQFLQGNIENMELPFPSESFDTILCADVLEHLIDPWAVVRRLADLLTPGGRLLASLPNLRNHRALTPIVLGGDFHYGEAGLLDRSHLRFFCRSNVVELFEQASLRIEAIEENMGAYGRHHRFLDRATFGMLHDFFVFQFRVSARKP